MLNELLVTKQRRLTDNEFKMGILLRGKEMNKQIKAKDGARKRPMLSNEQVKH